MADSGDLSSKIQISPEEYRRILAGQFRAEVTDTIWAKVRATFTLGGVLSLGTLAALGAFAANWLSGTVADQVKRQVDPLRTEMQAQAAQTRSALEALIGANAREAAREAVRADIVGVEDVRKRVAEGLPQQIATALRTREMIAIIEAETARRMADAAFWRQATRPVMAAQAGDPNLPPGARLFALSDLLRDREGEAMARSALVQSARYVAERGLPAGSDEPRFLRQALNAYATYLARADEASRSFAENQDLLVRALEITDPSDAATFETLVHRFDDPRSIAWLIERARRGTGNPRTLAWGALVSHPSGEARERVERLLCNDDTRRAVMDAVAARSVGMEGDPAGRRFRSIVRCVEDEVLERRLPPLADACLPGRDLLLLWRISRLPPRRTSDRRRADLRAELARTAKECDWEARLPEGNAAAGRWTTLRVVRAGSRPEPPMLGFEALLPLPADGTEATWLVQLATGQGEMAALFDASAARLPYLALVQERLAGLPDDLPQLREARLNLLQALAAAAPAAGRPAERLALDFLASNAGRQFCGPMVEFFIARPETIDTAPAAMAEALACFRRRDGVGERDWMPGFVRLAELVSTASRDDARRRAILVALTEAAGLGDEVALDGETVVPHLARWVVRLDSALVPDAAQVRLLGSLAEMDLNAVTAFFEQDASAPAYQRAVAALGAAEQQPLLAALPYLRPGFVADLPAAPAAPLAAAGRVWSVLPLDAPARLVAADAAGVALFRAEPFEVIPLRPLAHGIESRPLEPGRYVVGSMAAGQLQPGPEPTRAEGAIRLDAAASARLEPDVTYAASLGPPGFFEIAMERGRAYVVETFALAAELDTVVALLAPDGRRVAEDDDGGAESLASRICHQPAESGSFRLQVRHFGNAPSPPLGFEMRVSRVRGCQAPR